MSDTETLTLPNGWNLITHGGAEISVDPCGVLMFPRHCTPDEVPDYLAAMTVAAEIGTKIREDNTARAAANTSTGLRTSGSVLVTQGPPPPGAQPLPQRNRAAIGRTPTNPQHRRGSP